MAKTITINGKTTTLNLGMACLSDILDDFGIALVDLENIGSLTMKQAAMILHWGMYHQARISKQDYQGTWETACDLLDSDPAPIEAMVQVLTAFTDSVSSLNPPQDLDGGKKNGKRAAARHSVLPESTTSPQA